MQIVFLKAEEAEDDLIHKGMRAQIRWMMKTLTIEQSVQTEVHRFGVRVIDFERI